MERRDKIAVAAVAAAVAIIAGLALVEDQSGPDDASLHHNDVDRSAERRPSSPEPPSGVATKRREVPGDG